MPNEEENDFDIYVYECSMFMTGSIFNGILIFTFDFNDFFSLHSHRYIIRDKSSLVIVDGRYINVKSTKKMLYKVNGSIEQCHF